MARKTEPPTAVRRLNVALAKISALAFVFESDEVPAAQKQVAARDLNAVVQEAQEALSDMIETARKLLP